MTQTEVNPKEFRKVQEKKKKSHVLVVINDDFNTFPYVILLLIKVCGHTRIQAEQCANIIHYKGKCAVKYGEFEKLNDMRRKLVDAGLRAVVEKS